MSNNSICEAKMHLPMNDIYFLLNILIYSVIWKIKKTHVSHVCWYRQALY